MKSLFEIAKNAASGVDQDVPEEVLTSRRSICEGCPSLILPTKNCKECGCFIKAKTKFRQESCPLNKWGKWKAD